jgi:hypothetical protein
VGCLYSIGQGLRGERVLVEEAAEPIVPADRGRLRGFEWSRWLTALGGLEAERAVRPMAVVVADELGQHSL